MLIVMLPQVEIKIRIHHFVSTMMLDRLKQVFTLQG